MTAGVRSKLPDCPTFARLWRSGATEEDIAHVFGVSLDTVARLRRTYRYPNRNRYTRKLAATMPASAGRQPDPAGIVLEETCRQVASPPPMQGLSAAEVRALLATGGKYAALAELAGKWQRPLRQLQVLWHRARAA